MKKVLINATNLHNGGGVQVASSFISELSNMAISDFDLHVWVSNEVDKNISVERKEKFKSYRILNTFGLKGVISNRNLFDEFDVVFTVFGPCYYPVNGISIVGFAQAWIIYPNNEAYDLFSGLEKLKIKAKFFIQKMFFTKADCLIVELEHVQQGLIQQHIKNASNIEVVYNTVSNIYYQQENWQSIPLLSKVENSDIIKIGFLGRDYPHKNIDILPKVKIILEKEYNIDIQFYVTFNNEEWELKDKIFKKSINNVGSLNVAQCPNFYQKMDAIIFPSLLESFSITPLETMIMEKPLFTSDRNFVRDICQGYANYFDPLDAHSIAKSIYKYFASNDVTLRNEILKNAKEHAMAFSDATTRAKKYVKIIRNHL